jgi:hypothetical protein
MVNPIDLASTLCMLSIINVAPAEAVPNERMHFAEIHQCFVIPHGVTIERVNPVSNAVDTVGMRRVYVRLLFRLTSCAVDRNPLSVM